MPFATDIVRKSQFLLLNCFFCVATLNGSTPLGSDTVNEDDSAVLITLPANNGSQNFELWNFSQPPNGSLAYDSDASSPNLRYTPDLNFEGTDTFDWNGSEGGIYSVMYEFTITVTSVPDTPVIYTSGSTSDNFSINLNENVTSVATVTIADPDSTPSVVSDDPLFTLNQDGSDPKKWYLVLENPLDYESQQSIAKTQWNLTLTADDSASGGGNDTQSLVINLQEVNEPPVISFGSSTIQRTMSEDGNPTGWPGLSLSASDPEGDQISWSITTSPTYGSLGNPSPTGSGTSFDLNSYVPNQDFFGTDTFVVRAVATGGESYITANVIVGRQDDDAPIFTTPSSVISHPENTLSVYTFSAADPDTLGALTYTLDSGAVDNSYFEVDASSGTLSFLSSPDFENTSGKTTYTVTVTATDVAPTGGTTLSTEETITVNLHNVNEAPLINLSQTQTITLNEDSSWNGLTDLSVPLSASDEDAGDVLNWRYKSGEYPSSGTLTISGSGNSPTTFTYTPSADFQGDADSSTVDDNFTIEVYDGNGSVDELVFEFKIVPIEDDPRIYRVDNNQSLQNGVPVTVSVNENNPAQVYIYALEVDGQGITGFSFGSSSQDADKFDLAPSIPGNPLDPATLVISFKSGSEPDYEIPSDNGEDGTYELFIEVEDGNVPAGKDEIELHLVVADLNEAPAFASLVDLNASVQENQNFVGTLSATDQDAGTPNYHWEIIGGADQNYFQLSASSGDYVDLNFTSNPDFESPLDSGTNNTYEVIVKVWDDAASNANRKGKQETFNVTVTDVNDYPVLTLPPVVFVTEPEQFVIDLNVSGIIADEDNLNNSGSDDIYWSEIGGDVDVFYLDPNGSVYFNAPSDADTNVTIFSLDVNATDQRGGWMSDTLNIEVTQVPEAPEFPFQGPYQVNGLEDNDTVVYFSDVNASDPEGSTLTWSLHTPPDVSKGSLILSADGFTYSPVANQYGDSDFILTVSDSVLSSDLNFTVYVQPVNDPPSIEYDEVAYPYFNTGLIEIFESTESNRTLDIIQLDANDSQDGEPNPAGVTWNLAAKDDNASHTDVDLFYVSEAGMVSFLAFPDYETLLSESGNRDFEFKVYLTDRDGNSTSKDMKVRVKGVDEAPSLQNLSNQFLELSLDEDSNTSIDLRNYAVDPEGLALEWSLVEDANDYWDENRSTLSASTGELNYWPNGDFNGNDYFDVNASDPTGNWILLKIQATVNSINDLPSFEWPAGTISQDFDILDQNENQLITIHDFNASDVEDGVDQTRFTWSLTGKGGDASHGDYQYFKIDSSTGALSFITMPDYENDLSVSGLNQYELRVVLRDRNNGVATHDLTVRVMNVQETPYVVNHQQNIAVTLSEDQSPNSWAQQWTTELNATDPDIGDSAYWYQFNKSSTVGTVILNGSTGELGYAPPANYSGTTLIYLGISNDPTDPGVGNYDQNVTVTVVVDQVNDPPQIAPLTSSPLQVVEGDTTVGLFSANDDNGSDSQGLGIFGLDPSIAAYPPSNFSWSIEQTGSDYPLFDIVRDGNQSRLFFQDPAVYNLGGDNDYEVNVLVNDGSSSPSSITVPIQVLPKSNDAPFFPAFPVVDVNESSLSIPYSFEATDTEGDALTYEVVENNTTDYKRFTFKDSSVPEISFVQPIPDYESPDDLNADNVYELIIRVSDGIGQDEVAIQIRVLNLNDLPVLDSALVESFRNLAVQENVRRVVEMSATDDDGGTSMPEILYSVQDTQLGIMDNMKDGTFSPSSDPLPGAPNAFLTVVGDLDRDGDSDFVVLEKSANKVAMFVNQGPGAQLGDFLRQEVTSASGIGEPDHAVLSDLNEDGFLDLVVAYFGAGQISMFPGNGSGFNSGIVLASNLPGATFVGSVDLDRDDDVDVVAISDTDDKLIWIPNQGKPSFAFDDAQVLFQDGSLINSPRHFSIGDVDKDGDSDLAVASYDGNFTLFINEGNASFGSPTLIYPTEDSDTKGVGVLVELVDLNNDDRLDILTSSRSPNEIRAHFQKSDRVEFETGWKDQSLSAYASSIVTADVNEDSFPELLVAMPSNDKIFQYLNKGSAKDFEKTQEWLSGTYSINHLSLIEANQEKDLLSYSISGGKDRDWFEFDSSFSGKLLFINPPDYENPDDTEGFNEYEVRVSVTDGTDSVEELLVVRVENVNEPPVIDNFDGNSTAFWKQHQEHTFEVFDYDASNEGTGVSDPYQDVSFSIMGGEDNASFVIDRNTGLLSFAIDPDFENPVDSNQDNNYSVVILVSDGAGGSVTQDLVIEVQDGDDKPIILYSLGSDQANLNEDNELVFDLNNSDFNATDPEGTAIDWSILSGPSFGDASVSLGGFSLSYLPDPDYNGTDSLVLQATDQAGLSSAVTLHLNVSPVNDAPTIQTALDQNYSENQNTPILLEGFDKEGDALTWSTNGGDDEGRVIIVGNELTFSQGDKTKDFENPQSDDGDNLYEFILVVSDGNLSTEGNFSIAITNVNDFVPEVVNLDDNGTTSFGVPENSESVVSVLATDGDADDNVSLVYDLVPGFGDWTSFVMNSATGELSFRTAPDFEGISAPRSIDGDNRYVIKVSVSDGDGAEDNVVTREIIVNVEDADEYDPVFGVSGSTSLSPKLHPENTLEVLELNATDDMSTVFRYEITSGSDSSSFEINATTSLLSFREAPDFEDPSDKDAGGDYQVFVSVFDETNRSSEMEIVLQITNLDEDPILSKNQFFLNEDVNIAVDIEFNDPDTPGVLGISTHPIIRTNGTLGQLTDQNGTFYYYPNAHAYGTDNLEIALELSDRNLTYPLEFVIAEVDDQPIANADTFAYEAGDSSAGILEVLSNDVFAPDVGETLFVERIISDGLRGIVSLDANASAPSQSPLQFTPEAGFIGDTSFSYVLSDGNLTDQTTVSLRVATSESLPGWRYVGEFGFYYQPNSNQNWILHNHLGWLYVPELEELATSTWVWSEELGWIWTGNQYFVDFYLFSHDLQKWLYWQATADEEEWVLFDNTVPGESRMLTRKAYQVERVRNVIESLQSALSVSKYVSESVIFTNEEKDQIIRELLFTGSSSILETYGIELSF